MLLAFPANFTCGFDTKYFAIPFILDARNVRAPVAVIAITDDLLTLTGNNTASGDVLDVIEYPRRPFLLYLVL